MNLLITGTMIIGRSNGVLHSNWVLRLSQEVNL